MWYPEGKPLDASKGKNEDEPLDASKGKGKGKSPKAPKPKGKGERKLVTSVACEWCPLFTGIHHAKFDHVRARYHSRANEENEKGHEAGHGTIR